ncbi:MAG: response regulator [Deltaproteobacteria bacterium]|nr:response regulator [Deltaproteobacteria bacterium]MBW2024562.1 response regulator [Deltaproteobacteria bacterium]MBW2124759.1 response regulator [Deltaproteobacteria bacterium]
MAEYNLLRGKKILIVDDEPDVLDTLEQLLAMCEVKRATNFEEARSLLEKHIFDIAILDIMGVNGYGLLDIANEKGIIAVMLTAHALTPENVARSKTQGAWSFIPKEKIAEIASFLEDVLEAKEKGRNPWSRWLDRLADYFDKKFGPDWQKKHGITVR